jgi:hypothetical protein
MPEMSSGGITRFTLTCRTKNKTQKIHKNHDGKDLFYRVFSFFTQLKIPYYKGKESKNPKIER